MPKLRKRSGNNSDMDRNSPPVEEKPCSKIDYRDKLHIIAAVDKGQTKKEIGKEFGISPREVTQIYNQKDSVFKKCRQKFSFDADCTVDLWQRLLEWFIAKTNKNEVVVDADFKAKAEALVHSTNSNFEFTDEWFRKFRLSNTIIKHKQKVDDSPSIKEFEEWSNFILDMNEEDVYVAGTFGLLYMDDLQTFASNSLTYHNCVSVLLRTNISGTDKQALMVAGNAMTQSGIQSLPVQYFHKLSMKFDNCMIKTILKYWDGVLKEEGRHILLALLVPDSYLDGLDLHHIKILKCTDITFIVKTFNRLVHCFKYHYRKLQITQGLHHKSDSELLDNIHLMSLSWHNLSKNTIHQIFHPRFAGCYYFNNLKKNNEANEENDRFSLTEWATRYAIPLNMDETMLDNFTICDNNVPSLDNYVDSSDFVNMNEWFAQSEYCPSLLSVEAYQAAKRLVTYMRSQNASEGIMEILEQLEEEFEHETTRELIQNIEADVETECAD